MKQYKPKILSAKVKNSDCVLSTSEFILKRTLNFKYKSQTITATLPQSFSYTILFTRFFINDNALAFIALSRASCLSVDVLIRMGFTTF